MISSYSDKDNGIRNREVISTHHPSSLILHRLSYPIKHVYQDFCRPDGSAPGCARTGLASLLLPPPRSGSRCRMIPRSSMLFCKLPQTRPKASFARPSTSIMTPGLFVQKTIPRLALLPRTITASCSRILMLWTGAGYLGQVAFPSLVSGDADS